MSAHHDALECRQIFAMLSRYLDLDLPAETCAQVEAHIQDCPPCIEFLESMKHTIALCRDYPAGEMPPPLSRQSQVELRDAYQRMLAGRHESGS